MQKFSQIVMELQRKGPYRYHHRDKWIIDTAHAEERILQRSRLTKDQIETLYKRSIDALYDRGEDWLNRDQEYLFFSRSMQQGFVVDYRKDYKDPSGERQLITITFLPPGKQNAKPGTIKVYVESAVSQEFVDYVSSISMQPLAESAMQEGNSAFQIEDVDGSPVDLQFYFVEGRVWDFVGREVIEVD